MTAIPTAPPLETDVIQSGAVRPARALEANTGKTIEFAGAPPAPPAPKSTAGDSKASGAPRSTSSAPPPPERLADLKALGSKWADKGKLLTAHLETIRKEQAVQDIAFFSHEGARLCSDPPSSKFVVHADEVRRIVEGLSGDDRKIGLQKLTPERVHRNATVRALLTQFLFPPLVSICVEYDQDPLEFGFGGQAFGAGVVLSDRSFVFIRGEPRDHLAAVDKTTGRHGTYNPTSVVCARTLETLICVTVKDGGSLSAGFAKTMVATLGVADKMRKKDNL